MTFAVCVFLINNCPWLFVFLMKLPWLLLEFSSQSLYLSRGVFRFVLVKKLAKLSWVVVSTELVSWLSVQRVV
jgi:hypothetical protein